MTQDLNGQVSHFLSKLNCNTLVLTPNRRLANTWQGFFSTQQSQHKIAWERPLILPLMTWLEQVYQLMASSDDPQILKPWQEQFFWEKHFLSYKKDAHPIAITEWARMAMQSFSLCQAYQINLNDAAFKEQESSALFQFVCLSIQKKWQEKNYLSIHQLSAYLCKQFLSLPHFKQYTGYFPKHIYLLGFQTKHISKQLQTLVLALNQAGVATTWETVFETPGQFQRFVFKDAESQYLHAALYSKKQSEQTQSAFPIACIFPNLAENRSEIESIFLDVFEDASQFNISAGTPLSKEPIIACGLHILSLTPDSPLESWLPLITSPFIAAGTREKEARALFKKEIQASFPPDWTLQSFCETKIKTHCPQLQFQFKEWLAAFHHAPGTSHESWLTHFSMILNALGFPGDRSFNSKEHQSIQEWRSVWHRILLLDQLTLEKKRKRVFFRLKELTEQTIFQMQTPAAKIQVLGTLEGAGLPFSHLWLADIHDKNWPPAPKPNAFIPIRLQKQYKMPHASAERELSFCKDLLTTYFGQSARGIVSHAEHIQDQLFKPSFLIRSLEESPIAQLSVDIPSSKSEILFQQSELEFFLDEEAPALMLTKEIQGGVRILEDQALCPFRAFAIHRCHAKSTRQASISLTPAQRGELLHRAMEWIWKTIQDQHHLLELSPLSLSQLVLNALDKAYVSLSIERSMAFIEIEKSRLHRFILSWLSIEKLRPPFSVEACELKKTIVCGDLILNIRIDRIDKLETGGLLLIDYKTQDHFRLKSWLDERISDIQLPLYALQWSDCHALAIAQIHGKKHCFYGLSAQDVGLDDLGILSTHSDASNWPELISKWKTKLEKLAHDFIHGDARVYPKISSQPCHLCHLEKLCRIKDAPDAMKDIA